MTGRGRSVLPGPCFQEEADTRLFLHVADFVSEQLTQMSWLLPCLTRIKRDELLVAFGTGADFKYIPVHQLVEAIGPEIRSTLPVFHAMTGSDTVSLFDGRGKKTAWNRSLKHS